MRNRGLGTGEGALLGNRAGFMFGVIGIGMGGPGPQGGGE